MRRASKVVAGLSMAALSLAVTAGPALAEDPPEPPDGPPSNGGVTFESDGELLPVCLNVVRITILGTTVVELPKTCVG